MWAIDNYVAHFFSLFTNETQIIKNFSALFDNSVLFIIMAVLIYFKNKKMLIKILVFSLIVMVYVFGLKFFCARQRPFSMLHLNILQNLKANASFPSGHTTFSILLAYFVTFNHNKNSLKVSFWLLAIFISLSRIVILAHYVSDVVISTLLISLIYFGLEYIWRRFNFDNKIY